MFEFLEVIAVVALSMSGALTALYKRLDPFGVFVMAMATSFGGGTLRDVMIGRTPVFWMKSENLIYLYVAIIGYVLAIVFRKKLEYFRVSLFLFDTIGLGIYTVVGIEKGLGVGLDPIVCVILGTITACFGGVIRDILCAEVPNLFRKEIYATACIVGGIVFFVLRNFNLNEDILYLTTSLFIIVVRLLAVKYNWHIVPVKIED
ncbi:MAG: trimeric intracellular cation channel family protein [Flavobacterium sp.]